MKRLQFITSKKNLIKQFVVMLLPVLIISGCAVSLAPKFDQNIVDNLSSTSVQVFQLIATAESGTKKDDYNTREEKYNTVIGELTALQLQIDARPVPDNKIVNRIIDKANEHLKEKGLAGISANETAPSATAIKSVTDNIEKMKETDMQQGITKTEVQLFKNNIMLYLDQALTYERYLNQ